MKYVGTLDCKGAGTAFPCIQWHCNHWVYSLVSFMPKRLSCIHNGQLSMNVEKHQTTSTHAR